jgi:hypothetical protein
LQLHFIKDSMFGRGDASLDSFFYRFLSEVNATARAHVTALGGNALIAFRLVLQESGGRMYRNQQYNLISVTGDVVFVEPVSGVSEQQD